MKLSPKVRALWASILLRLPDSRLVIGGVQPGRATDALLHEFARAGVDPARLTILPYLPLEEYYRRFNEVDIALDTMPYSGGTTTCDALWMGVPVLTLPGSRPSSRSAASLLTSVGLEDWIVANPDQYVAAAVTFAREPAKLAELRRTLRERMRRSPLMDEAQFARDIEAAYRGMWRTWCRSAGS
jgi:predicted O-linked N-acetylglucosamine transferase (SPINDLY family)